MHFRGFKSPTFKWRTESEELKAIGRACPSAAVHICLLLRARWGHWGTELFKEMNQGCWQSSKEHIMKPWLSWPWLFTWQAQEIEVPCLIPCSCEEVIHGERLMFNLNLGNTMSLLSYNNKFWLDQLHQSHVEWRQRKSMWSFSSQIKLPQSFPKYDSPFSNLKNPLSVIPRMVYG